MRIQGRDREKERSMSAVVLGGFSLCEFANFLVVDKVQLSRYWTSRLLLAFAGYFVVGAYYNYSTYGARGADLIPYVCLDSYF